MKHQQPTPEIVALILALDREVDFIDGYKNRALTIEGRPLTDDDYDLIGSATSADLKAVVKEEKRRAKEVKAQYERHIAIHTLWTEHGRPDEKLGQLGDRLAVEQPDVAARLRALVRDAIMAERRW